MEQLVRGSRRARALGAGLLAGALLVTGCAAEDEPEAEPTSSPSAGGPVAQDLTVAVFGPRPVTEAYRTVVEGWAATHPDVEVEVVAYRDRARAMAGLARARAAGDAPDLFLADRTDLATLTATDAVRPLDDLLAAREVDFGDGFSRRGLEAFGMDAALQCMPVDVSPLVVYYNPTLLALDEILEPGRTPVSQERGWRLEEMALAASQLRGPGVRGLYVEPSLEQVAPFVWSGGGEVADDGEAPTTLTLSEDSSAEAMEELLTVVRDPRLTFDEAQLERRSAIERFEAGELGMLLGYRDLVGRFRATPGLSFDVMPMPVLDVGATSGRILGLCMSADAADEELVADLIVELIGDEGQQVLAETDYVMPSNLETLASDVFLTPGERPLHSSVFAREVRDIDVLPASESWAPVAAVASRQLSELFYDPVIDPLEDRLAAIDTASQPLLETGDPEDEEEPTD